MSSTAKSASNHHSGRLFFLDLSAGRILSVNPDGSDLKTVLTEGRGTHPDGLVVDGAAGHIYWTNMGNPSSNDGSIERCDLDGRNRTTIIPPGGTYTPKQLEQDTKNRKLYWSDREGMRVMRANLDGSKIETLVDTRRCAPRQRCEEMVRGHRGRPRGRQNLLDPEGARQGRPRSHLPR